MQYFRNIRFSSRQGAISLVITAFLILPAIDAIAKLMSSDISAGQISWTRFLIQTLIMAPFFLGAIRITKLDIFFHIPCVVF